MDIVETSTWTLQKFTIVLRPRFDSPAWGVYLIYCGEQLVGKQASYPSLSDCEWLLRNGNIYADSTAAPRLKGKSLPERADAHKRGGRSTKIKFGRG